MNLCAGLMAYFDWVDIAAAGFAAFAGGYAGFLATQRKDGKRIKETEKAKLTEYVYNLHFALRNISYYQMAKDAMAKDPKYRDPNNALSERIHFDFYETDLDFVCKDNPALYENIMQLKSDLKSFSMSCQIQPMVTLTLSCLCSYRKIVATIQNVNAYFIKKYHEKTLVRDQVLTNINKTEEYIKEQTEHFLQNIKDKKVSDADAVVLRNEIANIAKIPAEWRVEL